MDSGLQITERRSGDIVVLSVSGRFVADEQDPQFSNRINALAAQGLTRIVVDLQGVTLLDSGGIGVLVSKLLTLRRRGGDLRLARLNARTERVLSITRLLPVFAAFPSVEQAVRSFAAGAQPPELAGRGRAGHFRP